MTCFAHVPSPWRALHDVPAQSSSTVTADDYAWAARYSNVMNAQQAAYYASSVQHKGSPYVVKGTPPPHGFPHSHTQ